METTAFGSEQAFMDAFHAALRSGELTPYYQPKVNAVTGKLEGAEALVRWIRPDGAILSPAMFVPRLEENRGILELDWHMLRKTCDFLRRLKADGVHRKAISVNFSRIHVYEDDFVPTLVRTVDEYGVPHRFIEVEITESALVDRPERIIALIDDIHAEGFRVAIDDFGSGLSSLSFVKDVQADVLKLDKSLLSHNCEDEKERTVLESIIAFAHRLHLTAVAEGVETKEQLGFLRTCGCDTIQGFIFGKPMPEAEMRAQFERGGVQSEAEDILVTQASASATQLLLDAVFCEYSLVIMANLTRNSYYMMEYQNFTQTSCPSTGAFDELIYHGSLTMYPDDQEKFRTAFSRENLFAAHARGDKKVCAVTRQIGDDGVYRTVQTTDYFVKSPSSEDVLIIALCHNVD